MIILGVDPGCDYSAAVALNGAGIVEKIYLPNREFLDWLKGWHYAQATVPQLVVEMIASYGMPVGKEVFETCILIGRLLDRYPTLKRVTRIQVKSSLCHSGKATDANIRQRLLDIYGPQGRKASPGATFGISGDMWAALAVATAFRAGCKLYEAGTEA